MNFIKNNLKKIGIINCILILIGLSYDIYRIFNSKHIISSISIIFQIIAYCFALSYSLKGYQKDAAKTYLLFLCVYGISLISTLIRSFVISTSTISSMIILIIEIICILLLAIIKDLGIKKSLFLASTNFVLSIVKMIKQVFTAKKMMVALSSTLSSVIIGAVLIMCIIAKYLDKASRGSK